MVWGSGRLICGAVLYLSYCRQMIEKIRERGPLCNLVMHIVMS